MFKKIAAVALVGALLTVGMAPSQGATIKSGSACTKVGAKIKVGIKSYVCGINPSVTTTKNTWLLQECLTANKAYLSTVAQQKNYTSQVAATLTQLNASLQIAQDALDNSTKAYSDGQATFPAKIAAMQAVIDKSTPQAANAHAMVDKTTGAERLKWVSTATSFDKAISIAQNNISQFNRSLTRIQTAKDRATKQIASLNALITSTISSQATLNKQNIDNVAQAKKALGVACAKGL